MQLFTNPPFRMHYPIIIYILSFSFIISAGRFLIILFIMILYFRYISPLSF